MRYGRLHYTRAARTRLQMLPPEVRLNLENHLENISELVRVLPPERLLQFLARGEEGFVTAVEGVRVLFVVDATAGSDAGIDVVSSEFATIAAEQTALENLSREVADRIVTRLTVALREPA